MLSPAVAPSHPNGSPLLTLKGRILQSRYYNTLLALLCRQLTTPQLGPASVCGPRRPQPRPRDDPCPPCWSRLSSPATAAATRVTRPTQTRPRSRSTSWRVRKNNFKLSRFMARICYYSLALSQSLFRAWPYSLFLLFSPQIYCHASLLLVLDLSLLWIETHNNLMSMASGEWISIFIFSLSTAGEHHAAIHTNAAVQGQPRLWPWLPVALGLGLVILLS